MGILQARHVALLAAFLFTCWIVLFLFSAGLIIKPTVNRASTNTGSRERYRLPFLAVNSSELPALDQSNPDSSDMIPEHYTASNLPSQMDSVQVGPFRIAASKGKRWLLGPKPLIVSSTLRQELFTLTVTHEMDPKKLIWSSPRGKAFLQAAVGNDSLTPGNGEYRVVQNNQIITTYQSIDEFSTEPFVDHLKVNHPALTLTGRLWVDRWQDKHDLDESKKLNVLQYNFTFFYRKDKNKDRLHFRIQAQNIASSNVPHDRLIISFALDHDEEVFGLGEQFSLWSLRGHRIPILTREQGIGRGLQPITYILNHIPPRDPGYSGGDIYTTYSATSHFITSKSRSLSLFNTDLTIFDFTEKRSASVEVVDLTVSGIIYFGMRPFDLIDAATRRSNMKSGNENDWYRDHDGFGRMRPLPDWINNGAVLGIQGGEEKVLQVLDQMKEWNVPIAAVWLQDWVGTRLQQLNTSFPLPIFMPGYPSHNTILNIRSTNPQKRLWWNWEHDRHIYPNWETFAKTLDREYNVKIMAYINPFLSDVKSGMKPKGSWSRNYFQEASNQGYLVKRWKTVANGRRELVDYLVTSGPGLNAGMIDLSNPEACKWYKSLIKENMLANGVNGWMADFGEYLPYDGSIYLERIENKTLSAPYHNWYPREWARLNDEAIQEYFSKDPKKGDEIVFFSRSASRDSARFSRSYWNGDQMHIWNHLDGLESTGLSGMALTHSDIGGYTTINVDPVVRLIHGDRTVGVRIPIIDKRIRFVRQNRELFYRWMETAVFTSTAMFRTHEGSVPDENLQIWQNQDDANQFAFFTRMWQSLTPYRSLLMLEHARYGYPLIRPLFLHYPNIKAAIDMDRLSFMLGPLLYIVPITSPAVRTLNEVVRDDPSTDDPDTEPECLPMTAKGQLLQYFRESIASNMTEALTMISRLLGTKCHPEGKLLAPKKNPKPKHGLPFLPPGRWTHLWTDRELYSETGMFITGSSELIPCPIGLPPVFIREITKTDMEVMIGQETGSNREDIRYWLDSLHDGASPSVESAWQKYMALKASLLKFRQFAHPN